MSKNIVICCDGTGNGIDHPELDSNVVKLYRCLEIDKDQVAYYHPGVGTLGDPTHRNWIARQWARIKGLAFGAGLMPNVADAYRYLMNTYQDGDRIFLIGFSRGAYTARVLASVIHMCGLLCAGNEGLIPYILKLYSQWSRRAAYQDDAGPTFDAFKWSFSHQNVDIHFCGLWDTVSSYGWIYKPVKLAFQGNNPILRTARHALSIHERRCFYAAKPWKEPATPGNRDLRQVWFAGVHSDVGGSYPEPGSALSKIPLEWMLVEARKAGLHLLPDRVEVVLGRCACVVPGLPHFVAPSPDPAPNRSLHGIWWLVEFMLQRDPYEKRGYYIPRGRGRIVPAGARVHGTAFRHTWPGQLPAMEYQIEPEKRFSSPAGQPTPAREAVAAAQTTGSQKAPRPRLLERETIYSS